jgi:hypothetical protein
MNFTNLAGKIVLGTAHSEDFTGWAMEMLEKGFDSENLAILAGLSFEKNPDSEEIREYFYKSLKDLGLELPTEENSILSYAKYICSEIVAGNISPQNGLSILDGLYSKSDYEPIYSIWDELSEDIGMVNDREGCIFNTGITRENIDQYIVKVAEQFIKLTEIELPERFFWLTVCRKCGYIGENKLIRMDKPWMPEKLYRKIYRRGPTMKPVCSKCGKEFPLGMGDYVAREEYLKSLR